MSRTGAVRGQAYTFLKIGFGMEIGKSLYDKKGAELVPSLIAKAKEQNVELVLPKDWLCGQDFKNDQPTKLVTQAEGIPAVRPRCLVRARL